jgi:hypothetical protein
MPTFAPKCPHCGRLTKKSGEHDCQSIDLRGERRCGRCDKILASTGYERGRNWCRRCMQKEHGHPQHLKLKAMRRRLRAEFGGVCQLCGYNQCAAALQFHHVDDTHKYDYSGSRGSRSAAPREVEEHPERFRLLCANCHIETHEKLKQGTATGLEN